MPEITDIEDLYQVYPLNEYPEAENVNFPSEINITHVICGKVCGNEEFIVEGSTQICEYCYRKMLKVKTKKYILTTD